MLQSLEVFLRRFEQLIFLVVSGVFAVVPLFVWLPITKLLRIVFFDVLGIRRKIVLKNLKIAFPEWSAAKRRGCGRRSFELFLLNMIEFLRSGFFGVWPKAKIENLDLLEKVHENALAEGRTSMGIVFHMSNWEALGPILSRHGYKNTTISKSAGSGFGDRFLTFMRERNGMESMLINSARGGVYRKILGAISEGKLVGFPMDQHRYGAPYIKFFGKPAATNDSLAAIQKKQNLPLLLCYPVRTGLGRGKLVFEPFEYPVSSESDSKGDSTQKLLLAVNQSIESVIRKYPEQYFWLHNRWK